MTKEILETENEEWGFYGTTLNDYDDEETQERWNIAFKTLETLSGKSGEDIRVYLDSRSGRKLADVCCGRNDLAQAILEEYYKWIDKDLFSEEDERNPFKIEKDTTLFGTMVLTLSKTVQRLFYTRSKIQTEYSKIMPFVWAKMVANILLEWIIFHQQMIKMQHQYTSKATIIIV